MEPTITLICPTIGRSSLSGLVESVAGEMKAGDQFIIASDGPFITPPLFNLDLVAWPAASSTWDRGIRITESAERKGDFGCTPIMEALRSGMVMGDVVGFIGDDDLLPIGAFEKIRTGVMKHPGVPIIFSMLHQGRLLSNSLEHAQVSGQQLVVPYDMTRMPDMADCPPHLMHSSDWVFIKKVHEAWGCQTAFEDAIICTLPRQNHGRMF